MPEYLYEHPDTGEVISVFQKMLDKHEYFGEDGIEWRRVFTSPGAIIDSVSRINPYSKKEFIDKTGAKKGSMGDLWDRASEYSKIRKEKDGIDSHQQKYLADYKKKHGVEAMIPQEKKDVVKKGGITVDFRK